TNCRATGNRRNSLGMVSENGYESAILILLCRGSSECRYAVRSKCGVPNTEYHAWGRVYSGLALMLVTCRGGAGLPGPPGTLRPGGIIPGGIIGGAGTCRAPPSFQGGPGSNLTSVSADGRLNF